MITVSYIIKKTYNVIKHRFKISEFVDLIVDNIANIVPEDYVETILQLLSKIVDELIWI
ncbi:MAG: hypothetical protein ACTSPY_04760 [Candidatus Helarchaeota archaeon]